MEQFLDIPINSNSADRLGYAELAVSLSDIVKSQTNRSSVVVGLNGAWGAGKSSILEMMHNDVVTEGTENEIGLVVVPFSPWLITNRTALVSSFFAQLGVAIEQAEKRLPRTWGFFRKRTAQKLVTARKKLHKFSGVIAIASTAAIALDPTLVSAGLSVGAGAVQKLTAESESTKTLEEMKRDLSEALDEIAQRDPSFRILVLIDDLDRLDARDALEVLRLVKAVGDFPATNYLLAYDKPALVKAIEKSAQVDDGEVYLEKIIQFSVQVPPLEPFQLRYWLREELEKLFPDFREDKTGRANVVLDRWGGRLIHTPRDVKRLLFAVRVMWSKLQGRVDFIDLVWLQMTALKASDKKKDLYGWLEKYLQELDAIAIGGSVSGQKQSQEKLIDILRELGWRERDSEDDTMSFDYHHLDELLAGVTARYCSTESRDWTHQTNETELQQYREGKRLSSPWHWRLYFAFDAPSHAIMDEEWGILKRSAGESVETLEKTLGTILELRGDKRHDAADQILGRAIYEVAEDKLDFAHRWLIAIVEKASVMEERTKKDRWFGMTKYFELYLKDFVRHVFQKIEGEQRIETLERIFNDRRNIIVAADLVRDQIRLLEKPEFEQEENSYLSKQELADISSKQVRIYENIEPNQLPQLRAPYDILYAWRDIAKTNEGPKAFLERAFDTDEGLISSLEALRYVSSSAQEGVPHIPVGFLKNFADMDAVKARLKKVADGKADVAIDAKRLMELWWEER